MVCISATTRASSCSSMTKIGRGSRSHLNTTATSATSDISVINVINVTSDTDNAGEFPINGERSDARDVGARFIGPWGGVGHTPESVQRIREQQSPQPQQPQQLQQALQVIQSDLNHKRHQITPHHDCSGRPCFLSKRLQVWRIDFSIEVRAD